MSPDGEHDGPRTAGCGCQYDAAGRVFVDRCVCPSRAAPAAGRDLTAQDVWDAMEQGARHAWDAMEQGARHGERPGPHAVADFLNGIARPAVARSAAPADDTAAPDGFRALVQQLAELEADCTFWACRGPDVAPEDMVTCRVCWLIWDARQALARIPCQQGRQIVDSQHYITDQEHR